MPLTMLERMPVGGAAIASVSIISLRSLAVRSYISHSTQGSRDRDTREQSPGIQSANFGAAVAGCTNLTRLHLTVYVRSTYTPPASRPSVNRPISMSSPLPALNLGTLHFLDALSPPSLPSSTRVLFVMIVLFLLQEQDLPSSKFGFPTGIARGLACGVAMRALLVLTVAHMALSGREMATMNGTKLVT